LKILSIAVPSYNVEKTLDSTLQSLCLDEIIDLLDIIVVNDGSTDSTTDAATGFEKKYPNSVRVITKENGGHGSAVNTGIEAATGVYFKVVDGDDTLEEEGFIALIKLLSGSKADMIASNYKKVTSNSAAAPQTKRFEGIEYGRVYDFEDISKNKNIFFPMHSMTIKTSILKSNNIRLQEHTFYVDSEFVLLPIPFINTVEFMSEYVYLYNIGLPGQSVDFAVFVKRYDDMYRVVKRLIDYAASCGAEKSHLDYIYSGLMKLCFTNYMLAVFYDDDVKRGRVRAREFDAWLKSNSLRLYKELDKSIYIKLLRRTNFVFLPHGKRLKATVKKVYGAFKPLFRKKQRLTY
jgi:glycosyltransferase involved in cell wall biosynthesis